jgi:hypothetical protein
VVSRTFQAPVISHNATTMAGFEVPFDPKPVFGKTRAPVKVTINGYTYRSTIASYGGRWLLPLRRSNREAAGLTEAKTLKVTLTLDEEPRTVTPPQDLVKALRAAKLLPVFQKMSYTHQREHVEAVQSAKKPETRVRRIEACVKMVRSRAEKR